MEIVAFFSVINAHVLLYLTLELCVVFLAPFLQQKVRKVLTLEKSLEIVQCWCEIIVD